MTTIVTVVTFAIAWLTYLWLIRPLREAQERTLEVASIQREAARARSLTPRATG